MKKKQPGKRGKRSRRVVPAILLVFGAMEPLQAGEYAYGVGYTAEHSDNIALVSSNKRSDWIHSLLVGFAYQEQTVDLVTRVLAQATYNHYQDNSFGDETRFDLNSSAVWTISPQRFLWTLEDDYQQGLVDSTGVDTPANRTNVNVFSTGPDVYLHLTPVHTLTFGARAGDVYTGDADADNQRLTGTAAWVYQSSPITTLSLNYRMLDVKYENTALNDDFKSIDTFLRAQFHPSHSQYTLDIGRTRIDFNRGDDISGTLARLSWIRQSTPESSFGASISKEFLNTGTDVLATSSASAAAGSGTTTGQTPTVTGDVYTTKGGTIFYNHRGSQFGVQIDAGKRKLDFETTPQDRDETLGNLRLNYFFLGGSTTASMFAEYTKTEYLQTPRTDDVWNSGIGLNNRLNRTVSLGVEVRHRERTSTLSSADYAENRILFTALYSTSPLFTPLRRR